MKLIFLNPGHHKNVNAIKRMCNKTGIELEITTDINRCRRSDYNILISNMHFFSPDVIPESIKIIYGPELFVIPSGPIVGPLNPKWERCANNTLSKWVESTFLEVSKSLVIKTAQFPFAVDTEKFKPSGEKTLDCIVYFKHRDPQLLQNIKQLLDEKKVSYQVFSYGSYNEQDYLNTLQKSKFMLTLDAHESQGFALQEAMSCNVPLLVFDIQSVYDEYGTSFFNKYRPLELKATSVPYWDTSCGLKTTEISNIPAMIDQMLNTYQTFEPRKFIIENLSEEPCMQRILHFHNLNIESDKI
jgi:glycosyltransferase involved in cell wall biosynthesis